MTMNCWRCNSHIDENAITCSSCGASLLRGEPSTKEGNALRILYDTFGADNLFSNPTIVTNGLDDLLPSEGEYIQTVKYALNSSIGNLYINQIKAIGFSSGNFEEEIKAQLRNAGITSEESNTIVSTFNEMIGWNNSGTLDSTFALAIQFQRDNLLWGISSSPSSVFSAPLSNLASSKRNSFNSPSDVKNQLPDQLTSLVEKVAANTISLPCLTMKDRAAIDIAMSELGIHSPAIHSAVVSAAYQIDKVIDKPKNGSIKALCVLFSGTSYEIGIIDFCIEGIIEFIGRASHKTPNLDSDVTFDVLRNDICALIDSTNVKTFSRIIVSSNTPNYISQQLSAFFHIAIDTIDERSLFKGLLRRGEILLGKESGCVLLDAIDYSVFVNKQSILQNNTVIPASNAENITYYKSVEEPYLELRIQYFLDYCDAETIKLPIADILDVRSSRNDLSVRCSIDNLNRINLSVINISNNKERVFGWEYIKKQMIPAQTPVTSVPESDIAELIKKASSGDPVAQNSLGYHYQEGQFIEQNYTEAIKWYRKAAEQGNPTAENNLGFCYDNGYGVEKDDAQAVFWYSKSANHGNVYGQYGLAGCYDVGQGVQKDYSKAFQWYKEAAEQGYAPAQNMLGVYYQDGKGVEKNYREAIKWYRLAKEQDNAAAANNLGICYANGFGVEKDYVKAFTLQTLSANLGNIYGQYDLADCYYSGHGVEQNYSEAFRWYKTAAERGHTAAQNMLGICYQYGRGTEKNYTEAIKWYQKAAEQEYASAENNLGFCYDNGYGVETDHTQAFVWYNKAASHGNIYGQYELANCYDKGKGTSKNNVEAFRWYKAAAEQGHATAQNNLGYCYQHGLGVEQNYAEAFKWYSKSAEQGHATAQNNLGYCYQHGLGVEQNYAEAFKWYSKSAEQGNASAENNLGICYAHGYGVERDYSHAFLWYGKSANHGNMYGQYDLADCYDNGKGTEQNYAEAVKWYREAAAQGNSAAANNLGICLENGYGVEKDLSQALAWYSKSAIQGNMYGQYDLATCYEFGKGIQQSTEEARQWYQKAANQGLAAAKEKLSQL